MIWPGYGHSKVCTPALGGTMTKWRVVLVQGHGTRDMGEVGNVTVNGSTEPASHKGARGSWGTRRETGNFQQGVKSKVENISSVCVAILKIHPPIIEQAYPHLPAIAAYTLQNWGTSQLL